MKFDISRDERQNESVNKWKNNKGIGAIDAPPRFGKTTIGTKIITKVKNQTPDATVVLIVPSDAIRTIWKDKVGNNAEVYTRNYITRLGNDIKNINPWLLIVDELHKFADRSFRYSLDKLCEQSKFRLGLSGTYPYNNSFILSKFPVVDVIYEHEAIEKGWITPFDEYNIPVQLTEEEQDRYIKYSAFISETIELFKGKRKYVDESGQYISDDLQLIYACYSGLKYKKQYIKGNEIRDTLAKALGWKQNLNLSNNYNKKLDKYWNPNSIYERCKTFKNIVDYRNELINNNENKLKAVLEIIKLNDVPTIIFNDSIDFVNRLTEALGSKAIPYHSKIKSVPIYNEETNDWERYSTGRIIKYGAKRLKKIAIDGIKSGKFKYLITVRSLDEGLDLPELEQVIVTAGSANPVQQKQRTARAKTVNFNNIDGISNIFNLYIDDFTNSLGQSYKSRDKQKLIYRQKQYKHPVEWINSLQDITISNNKKAVQ